MNIALIIPKNGTKTEKSFYDYKYFSKFLLSKKYYSYLLAIPTLAECTPEKHTIRVFDENIENIDYHWDADLVGISVRTMFACRAYKIAAKYRAKGVTVVLGGIHPSMCTDEALLHCDSVVIGEAENVWPQLLLDFENNKLKRTYKADKKTDLTTVPLPRRSVLSQSRYFSDIVQTTKGCPFNCEFCSVYAYDGREIRCKTVNQVIQEIIDVKNSSATYKKRSIFFADDNIIANKHFARDLFAALKPYQINWSCQASINIAEEDELLSLMKDAGCGSILIGLESVSKKNLAKMNKKVNLKRDYVKAINNIHAHGILVHGSFILGYDFDTQESFDELIAFIEESKLLMPLINILTPFPGTQLFKRLEQEGRIMHKDWDRYTGQEVVFEPALMSPEDLLKGFKKVVKSIYAFDSIYRKLDYYWDIDFWQHSNTIDPIKLKYRFLFAARLVSLAASTNIKRTCFIVKIFPKLFQRNVRISTILTMMAYNDFAFYKG